MQEAIDPYLVLSQGFRPQVPGDDVPGCKGISAEELTV